MATRPIILAALLITASALAACGGNDSKKDVTARYKPIELETAGELTINGYLWQASLDTLNFMPLLSTDATGGTILTDWYTNPQTTDERMKVQVNIMDSRLRADVLQVSVSRQLQGQNGAWVDVPVQQSTIAGLEDAILVRARQIRIENVTD